jgi:hypothetical protein
MENLQSLEYKYYITFHNLSNEGVELSVLITNEEIIPN